MKTKVMYILLPCIILLAASGCALQHDISSENATEQGTATISSESATEATRENKETSPDEISTAGSSGPTISQGGESTNGNTTSHNQTSSGNAGGKQSSTSSSGSARSKPGGGTIGSGTSSGGGTTHSTPSSQTPSSTPSSKPESSSPPSKPDSGSSSPSKPNGGESSSKPAVPDYLKPYVYPFDIPAIKADLIAYGENLGMTHYTHHPDGTLRTPDNCSWWIPYLLDANCTDPARTRRQIQEHIAFDKDQFDLVDFTVYIETGPNNQYNFI